MRELQAGPDSRGAILVHGVSGTRRSGMFVVLSLLCRQVSSSLGEERAAAGHEAPRPARHVLLRDGASLRRLQGEGLLPPSRRVHRHLRRRQRPHRQVVARLSRGLEGSSSLLQEGEVQRIREAYAEKTVEEPKSIHDEEAP